MTNDENITLKAIERCIARQEKSFKVFLLLTSREIRYKAEQMIVRAGYTFTWQGEILVAQKVVHYTDFWNRTSCLSSEPTTKQTIQMNKEQKTKLRKQFLAELEAVETEMQTQPQAMVEARSLVSDSHKVYNDACSYNDRAQTEENIRQSRLLRRCEFLRGEITVLL